MARTGEGDDPADASSDDCADRYDVVVVGGGPAGCAAAVFTGRYGLETCVFDRGVGSLDRCAYLENYLGFPSGIDVETFQALAQDHARRSGCDVVTDLVESVRRSDTEEDPGRERDPGRKQDREMDWDRFVVVTQDGRRVTAERVVAATRYDGEYLRALGGDEMFETHEHGGEEHEHFDPDYPDVDGRTPVEGLYVASPAGERDVQAIVAAGRGAHVARVLIEDRRAERGYPPALAKEYDWLRPDTEFEGEWGERERWNEWFDDRVPEDADVDAERLADLREAYVDRAFETRRSPAEVRELTEEGHRRLAEALDPTAVVDAIDTEELVEALGTEELVVEMDTAELLCAVDTDRLQAELDDRSSTSEQSN